MRIQFDCETDKYLARVPVGTVRASLSRDTVGAEVDSRTSEDTQIGTFRITGCVFGSHPSAVSRPFDPSVCSMRCNELSNDARDALRLCATPKLARPSASSQHRGYIGSLIDPGVGCLAEPAAKPAAQEARGHFRRLEV